MSNKNRKETNSITELVKIVVKEVFDENNRKTLDEMFLNFPYHDAVRKIAREVFREEMDHIAQSVYDEKLEEAKKEVINPCPRFESFTCLCLCSEPCKYYKFKNDRQEKRGLTWSKEDNNRLRFCFFKFIKIMERQLGRTHMGIVMRIKDKILK